MTWPPALGREPVKHCHEPCQNVPGWCVRLDAPPHCLCGHEYPGTCQGGHPILLGTEWQKIAGLAADGVPFTTIARETGHSPGTVRKVVHGVRNPRLVVRRP